MGFKTFRLLLSKEKATFERDSNLEVLNLAESPFLGLLHCEGRGGEKFENFVSHVYSVVNSVKCC